MSQSAPFSRMMAFAFSSESSPRTAFGKSSANGYERLLLDAMLGDATLFSHRDGVEATWTLFTPILDAWAKNPDTSFPNYSAGSWGPSSVAMPLSDEAPDRDLVGLISPGSPGRPRWEGR
jgi:glucose-6-phosphate 1-dehydrogenase